MTARVRAVFVRFAMTATALTPLGRDLETLAMERSMALTVASPMAYNRPLTQAEKDARPVRGLTSDSIVDGPVSDRPRRRALLACLYIGLDCLDEAHELVTPDSSARSDAAYLHALLHRREGPHVGELGLTGFANSRYWFGVLETHPTFEKLPSLIDEAKPHEAKPPWNLEDLRRAPWDPDRFVRLCEDATKKNDLPVLAFCQRFQRLEWRLLLDHIKANLEE